MTAARRVLVVEDESVIREFLAALLEDEGYAVETAVHGGEALGKAHRLLPAVVIVDLMMPVMSGPEFIAAWQANAATERVPIVVTSAAYSPATAEAMGVQAFLRKPFDLARLLTVVKTLLDAQE